MSGGSIRPTDDDARSLATKLARFEAGLPAGERTLFRSRVLDAVAEFDDVEGHAMDMHWGEDANGIYFEWVSMRSGGALRDGGATKAYSSRSAESAREQAEQEKASPAAG
jgi:hypothetical protein